VFDLRLIPSSSEPCILACRTYHVVVALVVLEGHIVPRGDGAVSIFELESEAFGGCLSDLFGGRDRRKERRQDGTRQGRATPGSGMAGQQEQRQGRLSKLHDSILAGQSCDFQN